MSASCFQEPLPQRATKEPSQHNEKAINRPKATKAGYRSEETPPVFAARNGCDKKYPAAKNAVQKSRKNARIMRQCGGLFGCTVSSLKLASYMHIFIRVRVKTDVVVHIVGRSRPQAGCCRGKNRREKRTAGRKPPP